MQTARNMLAAVERNDPDYCSGADHDKQRAASLCAVLLHDVGHGPYSHVFEEVCHHLNVEFAHVRFGLKLIEETSIRSILDDAGLFDAVRTLIKQESGTSIYSNILSSQLDADRLDFLVRDRYFTGVEFGIIDMEWLFDCLRAMDVQAEAGTSEVKFYLSDKGLYAIEDFLSCYQRMYINVYFHKTTRAVQFMAQDILVGVFSTPEKAKLIPDHFVIKRFFADFPNFPISDYVHLDDASVIEFIRFVEMSKIAPENEIARRFFLRDLYKCFEPPRRPANALPQPRLAKMRKALSEKNIHFHSDILPRKGFKQYDISDPIYFKNILVWSNIDRGPMPVADLLPGTANWAAPIRFYFRTSDDRNKASEIWEALK